MKRGVRPQAAKHSAAPHHPTLTKEHQMNVSMNSTQTLNEPGTTQLPCGEIITTKPGELGTCTGRCDGDPR
jgi:hypothetical protein